MSDPLVVAHVITRLDVGGAQSTVIRTCALLDRERFNPVIIAGAGTGSGGSMAADAQVAGVPVVWVPSLVGPVNPVSDIVAIHQIRNILRDLSPSIVHTHSSKAGVVGRIAAPRYSHTVHTVHGWSFHAGQPKATQTVYRNIERVLAHRTSALVVVARIDREIGLQNCIGKPSSYRLIRSGVQLPSVPTATERNKTRAELGWGEQTLGLIAVGRLEDQKDPLTLLRALTQVVRQEPSARCVIVGDGQLRSRVQETINFLGLSQHVELLGVRNDVYRLMAAADLHVSAARWEGLPRTLLEASAVGIPSVVTDVGGVREIIRPLENGDLVPPAQPDQLANAIVQALADPARLRHWGLLVCGEVHSYGEGSMVKSTQQLYESLVRVAPRPRRPKRK